ADDARVALQVRQGAVEKGLVERGRAELAHRTRAAVRSNESCNESGDSSASSPRSSSVLSRSARAVRRSGMAKTYDAIDARLAAVIAAQNLFFASLLSA